MFLPEMRNGSPGVSDALLNSNSAMRATTLAFRHSSFTPSHPIGRIAKVPAGCYRRYVKLLPTFAAASFLIAPSHADQVVAWSDGFETSTTGFDINIEPGRQFGTPATYVGNPRPPATLATDYHQQIIGPNAPFGDRLLLAGDASAGLPSPNPTAGIAMVSPNRNFKGMAPEGAIGTRITVDFNVFANYNNAGRHLVHGGITIGASAPVTATAATVPHFAVRMVEDTFNVPPTGNYLQFYDGGTVVGNLVPHSAGTNSISLDLRVSDPADGDPWDGAGSTKIEVYVNAAKVGQYEKTGGGYANNYITLEGSQDFNGNGLALHHIDNLVVWAGVNLTPLQVWRQLNFGNYFSTGMGADTFDADYDGTANLFEYAAGTNPNQPTDTPLKLNPGPPLTVSYRRALLATDVTVLLETSPDLTPGSWVPAGGVDVETSNNGAIATYSRSIPSNGLPRNFVRSRVFIP